MLSKSIVTLLAAGSLATPALFAAEGKSDAEFTKKAAQGGMAEVKLGKLAEEKGSSAAVKEFGQHMVMDHTKANNELKAVAAAQKIELPMSIGEKNQATHDKLAKLSDKEFDQAYVADMVKDHKEDIAEFQTEAKDGKDAELKSFAKKTLPTLESHLSMIEKIQASEGTPSAKRTPAKKGGFFAFMNRS